MHKCVGKQKVTFILTQGPTSQGFTTWRRSWLMYLRSPKLKFKAKALSGKLVVFAFKLTIFLYS